MARSSSSVVIVGTRRGARLGAYTAVLLAAACASTVRALAPPPLPRLASTSELFPQLPGARRPTTILKATAPSSSNAAGSGSESHGSGGSGGNGGGGGDDEQRRSAGGRRVAVSDFCKGTNAFWKGLVVAPVRDAVAVRPGGTAGPGPLAKLTAAPEVPGIPRPVWLTILGSVPTALGWYGYYKFSVEEELYQYELRGGGGGGGGGGTDDDGEKGEGGGEEGLVSGCGGYGTLFPFVYGVLLGGGLELAGAEDLGGAVLDAAAAWILLGQVNLYRRVNELYEETGQAPPLHAWWALLPPPLDVVVGLRQVHFLSEFWQRERGLPAEDDVVATKLFPFIGQEARFSLKEFARTPSMWFWFTAGWGDLTWRVLQDED